MKNCNSSPKADPFIKPEGLSGSERPWAEKLKTCNEERGSLLIKENIFCHVCGGRARKNYSKIVEDKNFHFVKCVQCGFIFINPMPAPDFLYEFYRYSGNKNEAENISYDDLIKKEEKYPFSTKAAKEVIQKIKKYIPDSVFNNFSALLDVGCGYGFLAQEAKKNNFSVDAIEIADKERTICEKLAGIKVFPRSFEEFETEKKYSAILMNCILEHARDINFWIKKAYRLLAEGGIIFISVPNAKSIDHLLLGKNSPAVSPPLHLNYFNKSNLNIFLKKNGFEVLSVKDYSVMHPDIFLRRLPKSKIIPRTLLRKFLEITLPLFKTIFDFFHIGLAVRVYAKKSHK